MALSEPSFSFGLASKRPLAEVCPSQRVSDRAIAEMMSNDIFPRLLVHRMIGLGRRTQSREEGYRIACTSEHGVSLSYSKIESLAAFGLHDP